jgi:hypothetical protein
MINSRKGKTSNQFGVAMSAEELAVMAKKLNEMVGKYTV